MRKNATLFLGIGFCLIMALIIARDAVVRRPASESNRPSVQAPQTPQTPQEPQTPQAPQAPQTVPVYPTEKHRRTISCRIIKSEKFKDSRNNEVIVLVGGTDAGEIYRFDFQHRESQFLFGQMAAMLTETLTEGKPKSVKINISGIPAAVQESEDYTVMKKCKFVSWEIVR